MDLPFTPEQFFGVFADYNRQLWAVVVLWWLSTVAALVFVWQRPHRSAVLSYFLGALWLWNAAAYHAYHFTRINPAAWVFSAMFAVQCALFVAAGTGRDASYLSGSGINQSIGLVLIVYSLAYPFLTMALGHPYPATPTFGVPCPTVILTIGVLLTLDEDIPVRLSLIPVAWGFIGGSAAVLLAVFTDYVLLGAGLLLLLTLMSQRFRGLRPAH